MTSGGAPGIVVPGSLGASAGMTGRGGGRSDEGPAVFVGDGGARGAAVADALTLPISIALPAASPPWSASSFTRIAVTAAKAARGGFWTVATLEPSTSRLPQSAIGTTRFGAGAIVCPSTASPEIVDAETVPDELTEPAAALARTSSDSIVTSPPKSETASAPTDACALEETPGWATTRWFPEPIRRIDPSPG